MRDPRRLLADASLPTIRSRHINAGLAVIALALAALAVFAPPSLIAPIAGAFGGQGAVVTIGFAVLALLAAALSVWGPAVAADNDSRDGDRRAADESAIGTDTGSPGERVDDVLDHVESDAIPWQTGGAVARAAEDVWMELRHLAVEAVAERDGCSNTVASKRVATGEWTDDPYAASFLRDLSTPVLPAHVRIADWLRGRHLTRRIRHTVDAIAAARNASTAPTVTSAGDALAGRDDGGAAPAATDGAGIAPAGRDGAGVAPAPGATPTSGAESDPASGVTVESQTAVPGGLPAPAACAARRASNSGRRSGRRDTAPTPASWRVSGRPSSARFSATARCSCRRSWGVCTPPTGTPCPTPGPT